MGKTVMARGGILIFGCILAVVIVVVMAGTTSERLSLSFGVQAMDFSLDHGSSAWLAIRNNGDSAAKWGYRGAWVEIETADGWAMNHVNGGGIMEAGARAVVRVGLPPETRRWRVRYVASEASVRQRVAFKFWNRWDGRIRRIGREILPDKEGIERVFYSEWFEAAENFVQARTDTPQEKIDLTSITQTGL